MAFTRLFNFFRGTSQEQIARLNIKTKQLDDMKILVKDIFNNFDEIMKHKTGNEKDVKKQLQDKEVEKCRIKEEKESLETRLNKIKEDKEKMKQLFLNKLKNKNENEIELKSQIQKLEEEENKLKEENQKLLNEEILNDNFINELKLKIEESQFTLNCIMKKCDEAKNNFDILITRCTNEEPRTENDRYDIILQMTEHMERLMKENEELRKQIKLNEYNKEHEVNEINIKIIEKKVRYKKEIFVFSIASSMLMTEFKNMVAERIQLNSTEFQLQFEHMESNDETIEVYNVIKIAVKKVHYNSTVYSFTIPKKMSVGNLKKIVADKININSQNFNFLKHATGNQPISFMSNLEELRVIMKILTVVVNIEHETYLVPVTADMRGSQFVSEVGKVSNITVVGKQFTYNEKVLEESGTLNSYGIRDNCIISCV